MEGTLGNSLLIEIDDIVFRRHLGRASERPLSRPEPLTENPFILIDFVCYLCLYKNFPESLFMGITVKLAFYYYET